MGVQGISRGSGYLPVISLFEVETANEFIDMQ